MPTALPMNLFRAFSTILLFTVASGLCQLSASAAETSRPAAQAGTGFTADFAYYPYHNSASISVNFSKLPDRAAVKGIGLRIERRGMGEALAARALSAPGNFVSVCEWSLPVLGEGEYELVVRLDGADAAEKRIPFERHVFPWEHSQLGKSDRIVPPFTPIVVRDDSVSVVLRTHAIDALGLWRQVNSLGMDLFRRPMRLELRHGGRTELVAAQSIRFVERNGTRVVTESVFPGGTARSEWDYDGVMKWTLELEPDPRPIDALTLVIALDDRLMPLMHACTDGIRFNYAGEVPAGSGRVWDGSKAPRRSILGSYVPYIWVGAEERGMAVFGENDRGWVTDKDVPCQELRREGDSLELRLNLIAGPAIITQPRRIILGFQATPTKPMPTDWRLWTFGGVLIAKTGGAPSLSFLGSCWTWGALTPCLDVYPRDEDFSLWDKFREVRRTGNFEPSLLSDWLAKIPDPKERETARREVGAAFGAMSRRPSNVLLYTNPRGFRADTPEGRTFLDEWDRQLYPKRDWKRDYGPAYDVNPVESFRDYAVWHYAKMMTFADAIYWDDTFLQSDFNHVTTDAYALVDGRIQPAAGIWDMRALIRRTSVLDVELGRLPTNMAHMTNTAIAPVLAFAQTLYTWEDTRHGSDFQDRFSRDYVRAESTGRQHGAVAFAMVIVDKNDPVLAAWERRTATGVMLVHEIKTSGSMREWSSAYKKLLAFGYGQIGIRVFNYWSTDNPVWVGGSDAATLTLSKPGKALIVVCDYGNGGALTLAMPRALPGLPDRFKAQDLETGAPLEVTRDGLVHFNLRRHDYMLIGLEAE